MPNDRVLIVFLLSMLFSQIQNHLQQVISLNSTLLPSINHLIDNFSKLPVDLLRHKRHLQELIQKRHQENYLLLHAHPESWLENFIADFSKTRIWIRERLTIDAKSDSSHVVCCEFSGKLFDIKFKGR